MKVIDWPRDLVEEISLRRVVIFLDQGYLPIPLEPIIKLALLLGNFS